MSFSLKNSSAVPGTIGSLLQAELHEADLLIIAAAFGGYGVVSGCAVTAQGTPNNTVAVASGTVLVGGTSVAVTGGNVTCTADATNPRYILIEVDSAGTLSANAGTAAANPDKPTPTSTKTVLAEVFLIANDSAVNTVDITDKRVTIRQSTVVFYSTHTWTIDTPAVESGDTDFIKPMTVGEATNDVVEIERVEHKINAGTSVTWDLTVNGTGATGFTSLSSTTTTTNTNPSNVSVTDRDKIKPDVSAVSGTPLNWEVTVTLKHTVTVT